MMIDLLELLQFPVNIQQQMEPYNNMQALVNREAQAHQLQKLFNQKVIDMFVFECESITKAGINLNDFSHYYKLDHNMEQQYRSMKRILQESDRLLKLAQGPNEGWKSIQIDKKCSMAVRAHKTLMEMKSEGVLDVGMKNILQVAFLMKLYTECFPFCKEAFDIMQPTPLEKLGFLRLSIPIPLIKDRSCILRGIGFQYKQKPHKVCIYAEGVTEDKEYLNRYKVDSTNYMKNRELLDFKHFAVQMTCLGEKQISYIGYALIDHHMPILPERLILFVAKELGKHVFNKLIKEMQCFEKTVWAKELKENYQENAYFYDWIDQMIKSWVEEIQKKP